MPPFSVGRIEWPHATTHHSPSHITTSKPCSLQLCHLALCMPFKSYGMGMTVQMQSEYQSACDNIITGKCMQALVVMIPCIRMGIALCILHAEAIIA